MGGEKRKRLEWVGLNWPGMLYNLLDSKGGRIHEKHQQNQQMEEIYR